MIILKRERQRPLIINNIRTRIRNQLTNFYGEIQKLLTELAEYSRLNPTANSIPTDWENRYTALINDELKRMATEM